MGELPVVPPYYIIGGGMDQFPRVLLVDDENQFLEIFSAKLKAAGFQVQTARNGREALEAAGSYRPDLILLDMKMPGLSGADTLEEFKKRGMLKNTKVLFLSNIGAADPMAVQVDSKFSRDVGAIGYLKKTDDLNHLVYEIKLFLK